MQITDSRVPFENISREKTWVCSAETDMKFTLNKESFAVHFQKIYVSHFFLVTLVSPSKKPACDICHTTFKNLLFWRRDTFETLKDESKDAQN